MTAGFLQLVPTTASMVPAVLTTSPSLNPTWQSALSSAMTSPVAYMPATTVAAAPAQQYMLVPTSALASPYGTSAYGQTAGYQPLSTGYQAIAGYQPSLAAYQPSIAAYSPMSSPVYTTAGTSPYLTGYLPQTSAYTPVAAQMMTVASPYTNYGATANPYTSSYPISYPMSSSSLYSGMPSLNTGAYTGGFTAPNYGSYYPQTAAYTPTMSGMSGMGSAGNMNMGGLSNYNPYSALTAQYNANAASTAALYAAMYANSTGGGGSSMAGMNMGTTGAAGTGSTVAKFGLPAATGATTGMAGMAGMNMGGIPGAVSAAPKPGSPVMFAGGHTHDFIGNNGDNKIKSFGTTEFTDQFMEAHAKHYNGYNSMMYDATGSTLDINAIANNKLINNATQTKAADGTIKATYGVDTTLAGYRAAIDQVIADNKGIDTKSKAFYDKVGREIQNLNDKGQINAGNKQDGVDTSKSTDTMGHWTGVAVVDATGITKEGGVEVQGHQATEDKKFNDFITKDVNGDGVADKVLVSRNDNGGGDPNNFNNGHNMGTGAVVFWDGKSGNAPTTIDEALKIVKMKDNDDTSGLIGDASKIVDAVVQEGSYKGARDNGGKAAGDASVSRAMFGTSNSAMKMMPGTNEPALGGMGAMDMGGTTGANSMGNMAMGATGTIPGSVSGTGNPKAVGVPLTGNYTLDSATAAKAVSDAYASVLASLKNPGTGLNTANYGVTNPYNTAGTIAPYMSSTYPGVSYPGTSAYSGLTSPYAGLNTGYASSIPTGYNYGTGALPNYGTGTPLTSNYVILSDNGSQATQPAATLPYVQDGTLLNSALHTAGVAHTHTH